MTTRLDLSPEDADVLSDTLTLVGAPWWLCTALARAAGVSWV